MSEIVLSPKERQSLKGQAHRLNPIVLLGSDGLTEAVIKEIDRALNAHELIKVRVPGDDREALETIYRDIADRLQAARVQSIGKVLVFFRPAPETKPLPTNENQGRENQARAARPGRASTSKRPQSRARSSTATSSPIRRSSGRSR